MILKRFFGLIIIAIISLVLSYAYNYFFLSLAQRDEVDQVLMLFFLTCALIFIFFFLWVDGINIKFIKPKMDWLQTSSLQENAVGLFLAFIFFVIYLYYGNILNEFKQVDNLFDADVSSWMRRISSSDVKDFEMRGPHPFTYFIFQPFGRFLNIFTQNPSLSAILFNCATGGAGVFLTWLFVKRQFESKTYAFLFACLLGISSAHLFFSSVIDTYIFSAFALILFLVILQSKNSTILSLTAGGVLTFGITLTNFIQNFFSFLVARPRLREIIRFAGWTIAISLVLTYLHATIYPASKLFFLTPDIENEEKFFTNILKMSDWFIIGRLIYLVRTMLLYSVVAPKVFILTTEVGSFFPEFRFYKISIGTFHQTSYDGLGQWVILIWAAILALAGITFIWRLLRNKKVDLSFSLVLCLAFNFIIHITYGQELFLYSSDWNYALILFVAFGLSPFARNRIFQAAMILFLILLAYNQWQFMNTIVLAIEGFTPPAN